jgi:hypothetical protein
MERYANFGQEYFQVLAAQVLFSNNPHFLEYLTAPDAGVCVDARKRIIVIARLEVGFLLPGKLRSHPRNNR